MPKTSLATDGTLLLFCPGCGEHHGISVGPNGWQWNGDHESPTVSPSILVRGVVPITDEEHAQLMAGQKVEPVPRVCHSFVKDGRIQYLNDCTHKLANQTVELPEWE